jgi:hypothetical protein
MSSNLPDLEAMHVALREFRKIGKRNREILLKILAEDHEQLGDLLEDPYIELRKQYKAAGGRLGSDGHVGNFLETIKAVRQIGQLGLKEAKELVESW